MPVTVRAAVGGGEPVEVGHERRRAAPGSPRASAAVKLCRNSAGRVHRLRRRARRGGTAPAGRCAPRCCSGGWLSRRRRGVAALAASKSSRSASANAVRAARPVWISSRPITCEAVATRVRSVKPSSAAAARKLAMSAAIGPGGSSTPEAGQLAPDQVVIARPQMPGRASRTSRTTWWNPATPPAAVASGSSAQACGSGQRRRNVRAALAWLTPRNPSRAQCAAHSRRAGRPQERARRRARAASNSSRSNDGARWM